MKILGFFCDGLLYIFRKIRDYLRECEIRIYFEYQNSLTPSELFWKELPCLTIPVIISSGFDYEEVCQHRNKVEDAMSRVTSLVNELLKLYFQTDTSYSFRCIWGIPKGYLGFDSYKKNDNDFYVSLFTEGRDLEKKFSLTSFTPQTEFPPPFPDNLKGLDRPMETFSNVQLFGNLL